MDKTTENIKIKKIKNRIAGMCKKGQVEKAIELCHTTLKIDPTNADIHVSLGDLYLKKHLDIFQVTQYIEEAITEYQYALELDLDNPVIHYKLGMAFYYQNEFDKAINHFNTTINFDENNSNAYFMVARCLAKKNSFSEVFDYLEHSIKKAPFKASRAYYLKFLLLKARANKFSKHVEANMQFLLSLLTLPFDKHAQKEFFEKLSYLKFVNIFVKGLYYERTRNIYGAIELYTTEMEKAPGFIAFYQLLGDAYRSIGKIEDAINEYRMVLWFDPLNVIAYRSLCSLYEEQGDYDSAIFFYKKLIELNPNEPVYYSNLGNIFYLKGEINDAVSCYQTAITINPNNNWTSVIAQTLGYVLQESTENPDAAISAYQSASLLNPTDIDIYINLGSAFYEKGDYNNALMVYKVALEIEPRNARIHCNLGYLMWGKGLIDDAIAAYELSIKYDPEYDIAYNNLAVIYLDDLGRINKAIELFEKAIDSNPNYALAYYNWGRAMEMKNDNLEAARLYQTALDINSITKELDEDEIKARIDNLFG